MHRAEQIGTQRDLPPIAVVPQSMKLALLTPTEKAVYVKDHETLAMAARAYAEAAYYRYVEGGADDRDRDRDREGVERFTVEVGWL